MLTCRELTTLVSDYLEGSLSLGDRLRFQVHLGICSNCRRFLKQVRGTVGALRQLPPEEAIPGPVRDELLHRFRAWKQTPSQ